MKNGSFFVFLGVALFTLGTCGFNVFGGFFVFIELLIYGGILVEIDKQKAAEYLANKHDEEKRGAK